MHHNNNYATCRGVIRAGCYYVLCTHITLTMHSTCSTDLQHRLAIPTCHTDLQHRLAAPTDLQHGLATPTCHTDLKHRLATPTCHTDLKHRLAARTCSTASDLITVLQLRATTNPSQVSTTCRTDLPDRLFLLAAQTASQVGQPSRPAKSASQVGQPSRTLGGWVCKGGTQNVPSATNRSS